MRRTIFVMLMISAMLRTAFAGCAQAAESESGSAGEPESSAVQTDNTTQDHDLFRSIRSRKLGAFGIVIASAFGIASPCVCTEQSRLLRLSQKAG